MALPSRVRRTFRLVIPGSYRHEVEEELRFHLEERARELEAQGMSPRDARREAERRFGDLRAVRTRCLDLADRQERSVRMQERLDHLVRDLWTAGRNLRRHPGFAAAAVVTLALGLGANAAVFRAVEAVALRPLPFPGSDRLVSISGTVEADEVELRAASYPEVRDWRRGVEVLERLAAVSGRELSLTGGGDEGAAAERVSALLADPEYFEVLAVEPFMGRPLEAADNAPPQGVAHVVVGHGLWQRRLGGDASVLGRSLEVEGVRFEVVGVLPEGFAGTTGDQELWLPFRAGARLFGWSDDQVFEDRGTRGFGALGRLAPEASVDRAQAELDAVSKRLQRGHPDFHEGRGARVIALRELVLGDARESSWLLLGAAGLVWLVACVNVTNLLLARLAERRREIAVRASLGATRGRLAFQVLAEALVLSVLGGAAGFLLAAWGGDLLAALRPAGLPAYVGSAASAPFVGFLIGLTLVTALLLVAGPYLAALRGDPGRGLGGGRGAGSASVAGGPRLGGRRLGGRGLLVAGEVAVTLVVVVGAALLVQSFRAQVRVDPGFDPEGLTAARVQLPERRYDEAAVHRFAVELEERLAALPGVRSAALGSDVPLVSGYSATVVAAAERLAEDPEHEIRVYWHRVTPGFFATTGIRLQAGRTFDPPPTGADPAATGEEVVVSRRLAEAAWPGESPLGKQILFGDRAPYTVVGVAEPVRYRTLIPDPASPEDPDLYLPLAGNPPRRLALFVVGEGGIEVSAEALQAAVAELDPELPLFEAGPLAEALRQETAVARFSSTLFVLFGVLAAALAVVGVYGVMAYGVARRRREIGVRMALGAGRSRILGQVLGDGAAVAAAGVGVGLAIAWAASRLLSTGLYGTDPGDPVTYAAVALGLATTVLAASWLPARRAASTDPVQALEGG